MIQSDNHGRPLQQGSRVQIVPEKVAEMGWDPTCSKGIVLLLKDGSRCSVRLDSNQMIEIWPSDLELSGPSLSAEKFFEEYSGDVEPAKREKMRRDLHDHEWEHAYLGQQVPCITYMFRAAIRNLS